MDDIERHASQHAASQQITIPAAPGPTQSMAPPVRERRYDSVFSPARNQYGRVSMTQHYNSSYPHHGYQEQQNGSQQQRPASPIHGVESHYPPYLQNIRRSHDITHSPTSHQYPSYTPDSMLPPMQQPAFFDPMSNFQTGSPTVFKPVNNQYAMQSYIPSNDHGAVCMSGSVTQYITSPPEQPTYHSIPLCHTDHPSCPAVGNDYPDPDQPATPLRQDLHHNQPSASSRLLQCRQQLEATFDAIVADRVNEASNKILTVSRWLLSSIVELGLHLDDEVEYEARLSMWRDFNHCWEALAQKQKNILQEELQTRRRIRNKLSTRRMTIMVTELVSMCDPLEQFGLVDYEMGVWEEQIVSAFIYCLDLMKSNEEPTISEPSTSEPSRSEAEDVRHAQPVRC